MRFFKASSSQLFARLSERPECRRLAAGGGKFLGDSLLGDRVERLEQWMSSGGKVLRSERYHGAISRAFSVAQDVDDAKVSAKFEDGVLTLELPKKATVASKKIAIQ